ncbi:MAG TPA: TonB C-terminal domain-containing protein [Verrucomicrobiae bacterium]|nr:TonB C-terminal domain-containing protein [Verrucomicrobiae bacterium]
MGVYEEDEPSFFQKHRVIVGCGLVAALAIAVWFGQKLVNQTSRSHQEQRMVMVRLPPPPVTPPPPPPPRSQLPPPPTESEQKMIAQVPVVDMETKPDNTTKTETPADDSPGLATSIQGDGSGDGFGLHAGNNGLGFGTGKTTTGTGGRGSRWGWYAGQVQSAISQALQNDKNTRTADFRIEARIWADQAGRITRAHLAGSTGNAALDNALTNQVLIGLILQEPPPDGMPMPIVLRLTARHSNAALSRSYP